LLFPLATGEYIARQDADDISGLNFLLKNKDIDIYSTQSILINENGQLIKIIPNYFRRNGFDQKMMNLHNSLMIIKSCIIKNHKYSENFELYHRLIKLGYVILYDNKNISYKLSV
jgi:hypothetical protein